MASWSKDNFSKRKKVEILNYLHSWADLETKSQSVTDLYIAKYPLEKQIEYNSKLLNLNSTPAITKDDTKNMSKEEMANLLMELIEK